MTKKHYIAIARILAETRKQYVQFSREAETHVDESNGACTGIAQALGEYFAAENPMFNFEQFMRDSGAYDETARGEATSK